MIQEADHLVGIFDGAGEVLSLPHFVLSDPTTSDDVKFMTKHLFNITADMVMKLRTSIEGSLVMYMVLSGDVSEFHSFGNYDQLSYIPKRDYEKLRNLDDESRMMLENFDEYSSMDVNDPKSDYSDD